MKILSNESLKNYTTVKIGGYAEKLYFPESIEELSDLINQLSEEDYYIISGGSNILINDKKTYKNVVSLIKMDNSVMELGDGKFYVGASVKLQKLINIINKKGFGGIEYLFSVPALVGGSVAMNAGRGKVHGLSISDYIEEVRVLDKGVIKVLSKEECNFKYRDSIFKKNNNKLIVLGVTFTFDKGYPEELKKIRQERINISQSNQDASGYNFGSVFRKHNRVIMQVIRITHPGYKTGMSFSKKSSNWLINQGEGTYSQAISLITRVEKLHKVIGQKIIREVIIWK
ncbi:UDP-N-acetylmuramate dehydrogenase [Salipaludibacillus daqingensis]|uniref:UDP-N-acetylmuramate dehydrogenase n=1 Tax=Salipaludibacillus daqingensis TaxID=3041001 RepID=UPI0024733481|nr:FAD-binding protein [Salipaludibacillus daqingensis]